MDCGLHPILVDAIDFSKTLRTDASEDNSKIESDTLKEDVILSFEKILTVLF